MRTRRAVLTVSLVLLLALGSPASAAEGDLETSQRSAADAAAAVASARSALAVLEQESDAAVVEAERLEGRLAAVQGAVQAQAVDRFIHGAEPGTVDVLLQGDDLSGALRAGALARSVATETDAALDELVLATEDLAAARRRLAEVESLQEAAVEELADRADAANVELERQVRLAAERQAAEDEARRVAEEAARQAAPDAAGGPGPTAAGPGPTAAAPQSAERSSAGFLCPVDGPRAFSNDWGQPRSGGRRHQGTDMLSPRGTPVVASVSGSVRAHRSSLGGVSYYLTGDDGNTYFGTHLDSLSGASGRVEAGTVLGYVGNSGNAAGGPTHLHFEIQPGAGAGINPYPTLAASC